MKKILLFIVIALIFFPKHLLACEPCQETLNLIETIQKADLIIEGQKIANGPVSEAYDPAYAKPEWIEIGILEVLKGNTEKASVLVNSWDGMCPYGMVVDDRTYVFFLQKRQINDEDYEYDAVNKGCAQKTLVVERDEINFQGKEIPLKEFINLISTMQ